MFAISVLALGLSQFDKLALSALRPLEELGYYGLAVSISAGLGRLVQRYEARLEFAPDWRGRVR